MSNVYTVRLERIRIQRTRSPHTDTNYLTFSVKSGAAEPAQINAKLGDMPDGDYRVSDLIARNPQPSGMAPSNTSDFLDIVNPQDPVIISFAIANRGHASDQAAISELQQIGNNLVSTAFNSSSGTRPADDPNNAPNGASDMSMDSSGWGTKIDWAQIAKWAFTGILGIIFANCDGGVVAQTIRTTDAELAGNTQSGTFEKTLEFPGTDSPVGCGANSLYFVTYSITHKSVSDGRGRVGHPRGHGLIEVPE